MPFRSAWDIAQVILLLYLLIIVPLRVAFDAEVKFGSTAFWFDVFVDIYFIAVRNRQPHGLLAGIGVQR